jgi:hypothetical protein
LILISEELSATEWVEAVRTRESKKILFLEILIHIKKMVNSRKVLTLIVEIVAAKSETGNSQDQGDLQNILDSVLALQQTKIALKCKIYARKNHLLQMISLKCAKWCSTMMIFE